ncbi:uncharacterized protein LOC133636399 [Entelurus aequoreus]|uniref:uncharacterized protein LOC133636399 n=1 Tax=Entelurus aequoreus TaxID=161455 RepID=UPI002B1DFCC3|nr:uncharacterized protein LOC133636399 [Entelurus aequoreus]
MQLGGRRLTTAERERRFRLQLCLYCGGADHLISRCKELPRPAARPRARPHSPEDTSTRGRRSPSLAAGRMQLKVDASDSGVGAVLSQQSTSDQKLHPCAFFSRRLSPAEKNYDIGNRELLAVILALQEWRHWLEGAELPFIVYTDHKNLSYLRTAQRLNPRQARWALFLTRFNFIITFRPGSQNGKPDALSRVYSSSLEDSSPEPIVPHTHFIGGLQWDIERQVLEALKSDTSPRGCPPGRLFVVPRLRSSVLDWAHGSKIACHPGIRRTSFILSQRFWWPSILADTKAFVAACRVCSRNKASHQAPAGLLHPLPIPSRPWSHIAVDFVTGLPPSEGSDTILTIVDRFSKMAHFVALPKLPSALETAQLLVLHAFRLHGIPTDVVSDRGPQFSSAVWRAFCKSLGASPSLSSGYHPQSNGQTERTNQDLEAAIRCTCHQQPATWSESLPWIEYAHNSLISSATEGGYSATDIFQCYDTRTQTWEAKSSMLMGRCNHGSVEANGLIYVCGGSVGNPVSGTVIDDCEAFDPSTQEWRSLAAMKEPRKNRGLAVIDNTIYAFGGRGKKGPLNTVECYDIASDTWNAAPRMPLCSETVKCVVVRDVVYVFVGHKGASRLGRVMEYHTNEGGYSATDIFQCYDTRTQTWEAKSSMLMGRCDHGSVEANGLIYVCGGSVGNPVSGTVTDDCEAFDPSTQEWRSLAAMKEPRKNHGLAVIDNTIYAFGGRGKKGPLNTVECYDIASDTWNAAPRMPLCGETVKCAVVRDVVYVFVGHKGASRLGRVMEYHTNGDRWMTNYQMFHMPTSLVCAFKTCGGGNEESRRFPGTERLCCHPVVNIVILNEHRGVINYSFHVYVDF